MAQFQYLESLTQVALMTGIVGIGYPYMASLTCVVIVLGRVAYIALRKPDSHVVKMHAYGAAVAFSGMLIGCFFLVFLFHLTVHFLTGGEYIPIIEP